MLLSGGTYNEFYRGMCLNCQFGVSGSESQRFEFLDCFCWYLDLQVHQADTNMALAQIVVCVCEVRVLQAFSLSLYVWHLIVRFKGFSVDLLVSDSHSAAY